ncbi:nucleotidyl transferase AbiEii/AbiGii toxin family protein [Paenibacillus sp.]
MTDKAASVLARLKNRAKQSGKPLQVHLRLFCQEEFLRRLSLSRYADNLILKGGMFVYTLTQFESRPTKDVDFLLKQLAGSVESIQNVIREILAIDTGNDYIWFEAEGFETISLMREYPGVSFQLIGHIKDTKTPFTVDLGIDDVVVPGTIKRSIPVQLEGFTEPVISTYSLESTIAEKYEAILQRLEMTSRMKDFYDIYYLSNMFDYDGRVLQQAIWETLQKRGTQYNKDSLQAIGNFVGDAGMQNKWKQYLKAQKLKEPEFDVVVQAMLKFLGPVWDAIVREDEFFGNWQGRNAEWH